MSAGDYAKYYFKLRSLSSKLHISDELLERTNSREVHPLNLQTIQKLTSGSKEFEDVSKQLLNPRSLQFCLFFVVDDHFEDWLIFYFFNVIVVLVGGV